MILKQTDFRCGCCGKFIGFKSIDDGKVITEFTPDTHLTVEKLEFFHKKCLN